MICKITCKTINKQLREITTTVFQVNDTGASLYYFNYPNTNGNQY